MIKRIVVIAAAGLAALIPVIASAQSDAFRVGTVDPVRTLVYTIGVGGLEVIDGRTSQSTAYDVGGAFGPVVVNAITNKIYVGATGKIVEFDGATHATTVIAMHDTPVTLAMNLATNKIYATQSNGMLAVIDASTRAVTDVALPSAPTGDIAVNPVTNKIYLAGSNVQVVDGGTNTVTPLGHSASFGRIVANPATNRVFAIDGGASAPSFLVSIDGDTNAVTTTAVGGYVQPLAVNPLTDRVYIGASGNVAVIDGTTLAQVFVPAGNSVDDIAINTTTNKIYGVGGGGDHLLPSPQTAVVVDGATNAASPGPASGLQATVDPLANRLYAWNSILGPNGSQLRSWQSKDISVTPAPSTANPPTTTVTPLAGNASATSTPRFTFTTTPGVGGLPVLAVFFSVDSATGPWTRAAGTAPTFSARSAPLANGTHTLYAFAVDATVSGFANDRGTAVVGHMTSYDFTVADVCAGVACADLSVTRTTTPSVGFTGKDALYRLRVTNNGAASASAVILTDTLPADAQYVWATPGCGPSANTVACNLGNMANGASVDVTIVFRPGSAGTATSTATVDAAELDPQVDDNTSTANVSVTNPPPANIVPRYRLYSPVSLEHHYTMDANEYAVLGASGAWVQEGQVGNVLDNPGSYNGVQAVPYYRLYNTFTRWHHWTTDPNEYYTLITFPGWGGEDVAGYIFPTQAPGTTQLYRLTYPFIGGLHHWTIDANEYNTLISQYGWVGEGGSGFVIQ